MRVETERPTTVAVEHEIGRIDRGAGYPASWGAIWAGFFVGLGAELILTVLMLGIFGTTFLSVAGTTSGASFGIGIAAWIFCQSVVAYFLGGFVAGRLSRAGHPGTHGAAVWGLITAVLLYFILNIGMRGAFGMASAAAPATGAPAMQMAGWVLIYFFVVFIASMGAAIGGGRSGAHR